MGRCLTEDNTSETFGNCMCWIEQKGILGRTLLKESWKIGIPHFLQNMQITRSGKDGNVVMQPIIQMLPKNQYTFNTIHNNKYTTHVVCDPLLCSQAFS